MLSQLVRNMYISFWEAAIKELLIKDWIYWDD
jgi:hypothetical protein